MDAVEQARLLAGRYRLNSVIGRGGMGSVWHARDEVLGRDVAVKEIAWPPSLDEAERQTARRRAVQEAQMAARLRHPNVVLIYDILEDDGRPWIVMEYLPYRSLRDMVLEDGPLSPAQAAQLGLGILAALRAAHAEGVVHRDVKPANILVGPDGRTVLTDFGISRAADSPTLTNSGLLIGSPSYIAPERARGGHAGPAGDLWGLGASLYAAVEGRPPFEREGALATLTAVVADEPDPATHAGPLWPVISGLLRKDPATRPGPDDAEAMLRRVAPGRDGRPRWLGGLTRRGSGALGAPSPPREPREQYAAAMPVLPADAQQAPAPTRADQQVPAAAPPALATAAEAVPPLTPKPQSPPAPVPAEQGAAVTQVQEALPWEPASSKPGPIVAGGPEPQAPEPMPAEPQGPAVLPDAADARETEASRRPVPDSPVPDSPVPGPAVPRQVERTPPHAPVPPPEAVPAASTPGLPASPGRGTRRGLGLLAAVAGVTVAAATALALTLSGSPGHQSVSPPGRPHPGASTASVSAPASRPGTSASPSGGATSPSAGATSPSASATSPSGAPSSASSPAGTPDGGALPGGYYRFTNSTGFSIGVPQGWQVSHAGHYVYIRNPGGGGVYLLIDQSDTPKADPLADWRQQEASRAGSYAGYHRIRLESVSYPQAEKAADWEFTYYDNGVLTHVLNRNVRANAHHAYALYWATPQSDWAADYHYFQAFAATFLPAAP